MIASTGRKYTSSVVSQPVALDLDETTFRLPLIERGEEVYFTPPR